MLISKKLTGCLKQEIGHFCTTNLTLTKPGNYGNKPFLEVVEECIPKTTIYKENSIPCMQQNIKLKIKKRNRVYKRAKQTGKVHLLQQYKKLRNDVASLRKEYLRKSSTQGL